MFTLTISKSDIRAMLQFAAKKDVRFYLNGIFFEAGAKGARMVATDGHILGCQDISANLAEPVTEAQCGIIPRQIFENVKKPKKGDAQMLEISIGDGKFTVKDGFAVYQGDLIDGRFPDWRMIVPAKASGEVGQFDVELLTRLKAAHDETAEKNDKHIVLHHNGSGAALVRIGLHGMMALIMPIRVEMLESDVSFGSMMDSIH